MGFKFAKPSTTMDASFRVPERKISLKKYDAYDQSHQLWKDTMQCAHQVPTVKFNEKAKGWEAISFSFDDIEVIPSRVDYLKVVTYNVWFDAHNFDARAEHLFRMLESSDADFICLQEVTHRLISMIFKESWLKNYYVARNKMSHYGLMVLSRWPCVFKELSFNTEMNRTAIVAETKINGEIVAIASSHLESLESNRDYRENQMSQTFSFLENYQNAMFMGDFNFGDNYRENKLIPESYDDLWKSFNNIETEPGYTMPKTSDFRAWRPDHILASQSSFWTPHQINRVGYEVIGVYGEEAGQSMLDQVCKTVKTPSDHYGLVATMKLNDQESSQEAS